MATLIYMADERIFSGGICDKLSRISLLYLHSRELKANFKIYFDNPFNLQDYLLPNKYDWFINKGDILYNENTIAVSSFDYDYAIEKVEGVENKVVAPSVFLQTIHELVKNGRYSQILCYFHIPTPNLDEIFRTIFLDLFIPSHNLSNSVTQNLEKIGHNFIAVHFRFQKLLGDFKENPRVHYTVLDKDAQKILIKLCIAHLCEITQNYSNYGMKVLVCSDSSSFLKEAKQFDFVYVVDGYEKGIKHIGQKDEEVDCETTLKLFTDLLLMSYAKKIYSVIDGEMYPSSFARTAALIGGTEFERKTF